jgi:glycosyltransferase involved in cell wall biosynthesis
MRPHLFSALGQFRMTPATPPSAASAGEARRWAAGLRVALVHDWLLRARGGERVLESLLRLFPRAEIHTLLYDPAGLGETINRRSIRPSWMSSLPGVGAYYRALLPLMPATIERRKFNGELDLILSTSHCVAHGAIAPRGVPHLTYCFSPMRYLYDQREAYALGGAGASTRALGWIAPRLRRWDARAARRCGGYWCISRFVADRIERVYGLKATVIHPPVRTDFFTPPDGGAPTAAQNGAARGADAPFLIVSALAPYKRIDVAIAAANALGRELWIAGAGPMERRLRAMAGPSVRFLGWRGDEALRELYRTCAALIFPGEEDFGLTPLEAMACGRPVLGLRAGGLMETHREGVTGEFFGPAEGGNAVEALVKAWERFDPEAYDSEAIRRHAEQFGEERFLDRMASKLAETYPERRSRARARPEISNPKSQI